MKYRLQISFGLLKCSSYDANFESNTSVTFGRYFLLLFEGHSVWPDVGIKSSPIFSKSCPKAVTGLLLKKCLIKPNSHHVYFGYFCNKIWDQDLSKRA